MVWSVADAKHRLSELLRATAVEPQPIANRQTTVAVVVSAAEFEEFRVWKARRDAITVADVFSELREILDAEGASFETAPRSDRPNSFVAVLDDPAV
jgi:prevent-host-death family protein